MVITEAHIKDIEKKLKDKLAQRQMNKRYKKIKFEHNHPILFKILEFFNKDKLQRGVCMAKVKEKKEVNKVQV